MTPLFGGAQLLLDSFIYFLTTVVLVTYGIKRPTSVASFGTVKPDLCIEEGGQLDARKEVGQRSVV